MNRVFATASFIPRTCARRLSTTEVNHVKVDLSKIKKKQMHFQANDEVPVYLKGGSVDYALLIATIGLLVVGLSASVRSAYSLATKK